MLNTLKRRIVALSYGLVCHGLFAIAVWWMAWGLILGMTQGRGGLDGIAAILVNTLLVVQFPLLHSWLLGGGSRQVNRFLAPACYRATLAPTLYVILASLQVILLFRAWSPIGEPFFVASGSLRTFCWFGSALSWGLLAKSMADANLALQSGALGWLSLFQGKKPNYGPLPTTGLFAVCRQPIYLAFAAITWTGPVWTIDRVFVTLTLTAYCFFGPIWKERRFEKIHGERFRAYCAEVPYMPGWGRHGVAGARHAIEREVAQHSKWGSA